MSGTATGPAPVNTVNSRSDGWVDPRNVEYDDWVRRAPATVAIATPPTAPSNNTTAR